jgi:hypothetical protein
VDKLRVLAMNNQTKGIQIQADGAPDLPTHPDALTAGSATGAAGHD